jgi:polyhydroxyalkanoate synthesis regulator phasin
MAETAKLNGNKAVKVPEFLREPLEAAQARLGQFEEDAERVLKDLMDRGRASRKEFEHIVSKLSKQDWTIPEMKHRIEKLRDQGVERAAEWRGRAETFRTEAMDRMTDLQGRAIAFLGVATRDQVEELSREIDRLARKIAKGGPKKARKAARSGAEL